MKPFHRLTIYTSGNPGEMNPTTEGYANADSISVSNELRVRPSEGYEFQISDEDLTLGIDESLPERGWVDFSLCAGSRPDYGICTSTLPSEAGSGECLGERTPKIFWTGTVIPQSGFSRFLIKLGFWFDGVIWEGANPRSDGEGGWL